MRKTKTPTPKETVSNFDPNGSYTGTPVDGGRPVQDVDDL